MDERNKLNYGIILTIALTVIGWATTAGVTTQQIKTNTRDIERLTQIHDSDIMKVQSRQDNTDTLLQSINSQLVELNTKMSLLIKGSLKTDKE